MCNFNPSLHCCLLFLLYFWQAFSCCPPPSLLFHKILHFSLPTCFQQFVPTTICSLHIFFAQCLPELHNKSKFTKYFLSPLCKTRFDWAIVGLLSYFVPRWTLGSFEFCTCDIASLYPQLLLQHSSAACPASKALPHQPIILCGLCINLSTWIVQGNPLLSLVFPRLWTCHTIQRVLHIASGWWMAGRHSLSGMLGLQKFHKVQIKLALTLSSFGGWLGLRISPALPGEVMLSNLLLLG